MQYTFSTYIYNYTVEVTFEHTCEEPPIYHPTDLAHPGMPELLELHSIMYKDVEIIDFVSEEIHEDIMKSAEQHIANLNEPDCVLIGDDYDTE